MKLSMIPTTNCDFEIVYFAQFYSHLTYLNSLQLTMPLPPTKRINVKIEVPQATGNQAYTWVGTNLEPAS